MKTIVTTALAALMLAQAAPASAPQLPPGYLALQRKVVALQTEMQRLPDMDALITNQSNDHVTLSRLAARVAANEQRDRDAWRAQIAVNQNVIASLQAVEDALRTLRR